MKGLVNSLKVSLLLLSNADFVKDFPPRIVSHMLTHFFPIYSFLWPTLNANDSMLFGHYSLFEGLIREKP